MRQGGFMRASTFEAIILIMFLIGTVSSGAYIMYQINTTNYSQGGTR